MKMLRALFICLAISYGVYAQSTAPISEPKLVGSMERAWQTIWDRFYHPKTNMFYDYLTSYQSGKSLSHLPKQSEISIQWPNYQGYGTGMEDCMISAGVLLDMIVDKYEVTHNRRLFKSAEKIVEGIWKCSTVHGVVGFLARGISPYAPDHIYINSSRDQYTHVVHGLWKYYNSELIDAEGRKTVAKLLTDYADRMIENVTKENDFDALRANNTPDTRGISKMWEVMGHEAARLPMMYGVAWKVSGDDRYRDQFNRYLTEAIAQSYYVEQNMPTYSILQIQNSMEVLNDIVEDDETRSKIAEIMVMASEMAQGRFRKAVTKSNELDLTMIVNDWRTAYGGIKSGSLSRVVWYNTREIGEAALAQLMVNGRGMSQSDLELLTTTLTDLDYERLSSNGIYYLQGAYWKARRNGWFD